VKPKKVRSRKEKPAVEAAAAEPEQPAAEPGVSTAEPEIAAVEPEEEETVVFLGGDAEDEADGGGNGDAEAGDESGDGERG
jgi:hypothetical protein